MKFAFFLLVLVFFIAGCVTLTDTPGPTVLPTAIDVGVVNRSTINGETRITTVPTVPPSDGSPSITTTARPSNPDRGETFSLTVSSADDVGVKTLSWESADAFSTKPESNSFDCGLQKNCSNSWGFSSKEDGLKTITVYATDSSGQKSSRVPVAINVRPFDFRAPSISICGNGVCEKGETNSSCSSDCGSKDTICGNRVCNAGEAFETCPGDCPYKAFACANAICEGGESYKSCPQDCSVSAIIGSACGDGACEPGEDAAYCPADCTSIKPNCGNNICDSWETESSCRADCQGTSGAAKTCTSNAACGYKQVCTGGKCVSVDCTNDAQCGYAKECENNRCVRCPSGPYGPAC